jgi:hypothetical protein
MFIIPQITMSDSTVVVKSELDTESAKEKPVDNLTDTGTPSTMSDNTAEIRSEPDTVIATAPDNGKPTNNLTNTGTHVTDVVVSVNGVNKSQASTETDVVDKVKEEASDVCNEEMSGTNIDDMVDLGGTVQIFKIFVLFLIL